MSQFASIVTKFWQCNLLQKKASTFEGLIAVTFKKGVIIQLYQFYGQILIHSKVSALFRVSHFPPNYASFFCKIYNNSVLLRRQELSENTDLAINVGHYYYLKLVSAIFYQIFIFSSPNNSPPKTMTSVFYFI